jgi:hypothetical protein
MQNHKSKSAKKAKSLCVFKRNMIFLTEKWTIDIYFFTLEG